MPETGNRLERKPGGSGPRDGRLRIGVYTCYCGGNISDVVDCERVAQAMSTLPDVVVSRTNMSMCSDSGQALIEEDIREYGLNRVVVGACSPFLHEQTFRGALVRAGLNPYFYHHVGLREQVSWTTHNDPLGATRKAIRLMNAGVAKARLLDPLEPIRLEANKHALVIGGGVAGMRAALDIARRGLKVSLIEKTPFLGGHMAQLETVFPDEAPARSLLDDLIRQVVEHPNLTVFTQTEIIGLKGYIGDFQAQFRRNPRGVSPECTECDRAISSCPVEVPDEFTYGLTKRKAIFTRFPGCYPVTPAIDWNHCTRCGECLAAVNGRGIDLQAQPEEFALNVGAIVMATGFEPYVPNAGEFGYAELPDVVTLPQFIRIMADQDGDFMWNGHPVSQVAVIHCVGSRQIEGVHEPTPDGTLNEYCSRVCCTAALHALDHLVQHFPNAMAFDFYQDIRTYGRGHEDYYRRVTESGVRFVRYHGDEPPVVEANDPDDRYPLTVSVKDYLTWGEEFEIPFDLVVLVTGMIPSAVGDLQKLLKISPGTDRFLLEVHPKLQPVETAVKGIVLAGTAQSPMNILECAASAEAAAAKVSGMLSQGTVELEPFVARVNPGRCQGTGTCLEVCEYEDAISLSPHRVNGNETLRAVVTPANCVGCGVCVGACPNEAIDVQGWTLAQYRAMVDALLDDAPLSQVGL